MRIANSPPRRAIRLVSTLPPRSSSNPVTFSTKPILSGPVKVRTNVFCMESYPIRKGLQEDALVIIATKQATHPRLGLPPIRPGSSWLPVPPWTDHWSNAKMKDGRATGRVRRVLDDAPAFMEWCVCANLTHPTNDNQDDGRVVLPEFTRSIVVKLER